MSEVAPHIATSSVTRAMDVIGDRWAVLIMRDAIQGARRFEEFIERTGATRATLANRLRALVAQGLLARVRYSESPTRYEYRLTRVIEPRNDEIAGAEAVTYGRTQHVQCRYARRCRPAGVEEHTTRKWIVPEPGIPRVWPPLSVLAVRIGKVSSRSR